MIPYRLYKQDGDDPEKWYLMPQRGGNNGPAEYCLDQQSAAIFYTPAAWETWGKWSGGLQREELPDDQQMRLTGAPMLPGLEPASR